jgi:hypothetical protein
MKCKRCNKQGHCSHDCVRHSMPVTQVGIPGIPLPVDPNDVFIHSSVSDSLMIKKYISKSPTNPKRVCGAFGRNVESTYM